MLPHNACPACPERGRRERTEGPELPFPGESAPAEISYRRALGRMSFPKIAHALNVTVRRLAVQWP